MADFDFDFEAIADIREAVAESMEETGDRGGSSFRARALTCVHLDEIEVPEVPVDALDPGSQATKRGPGRPRTTKAHAHR